MPLPDMESPEQSLGDCAICMDAILVEPSLRRRNKSTDEHSEWDTSKEKGGSGGLLNAVQMGVSGRKNYSLAPCHHLFVSVVHHSFKCWSSLTSIMQHTECLERVSISFLSFPRNARLLLLKTPLSGLLSRSVLITDCPLLFWHLD